MPTWPGPRIYETAENWNRKIRKIEKGYGREMSKFFPIFLIFL
jgi:hypothetical protein